MQLPKKNSIFVICLMPHNKCLVYSHKCATQRMRSDEEKKMHSHVININRNFSFISSYSRGLYLKSSVIN